MANDNVQLSQNNTNGAIMRTFADNTNAEWAAAAVSYVATLNANNNVMQPVTANAGLPVAQQGTWNTAITGTVPVSGTFFPAVQTVNGNTNTAIVGTVPVNAVQITSPWIVNGNTNATILGTVPVNAVQITSPCVVTGNTNAAITGTVPVNATQITSPWIVNGNTNATILGTVPVNATQITSPWIVNGNMNATVLGTVPVNATQIGAPVDDLWQHQCKPGRNVERDHQHGAPSGHEPSRASVSLG